MKAEWKSRHTWARFICHVSVYRSSDLRLIRLWKMNSSLTCPDLVSMSTQAPTVGDWFSWINFNFSFYPNFSRRAPSRLHFLIFRGNYLISHLSSSSLLLMVELNWQTVLALFLFLPQAIYNFNNNTRSHFPSQHEEIFSLPNYNYFLFRI